MKAQAGQSAYFHRAGVLRGVPALLITGIAIILFSTAGIARMLGWGPGSTDETGGILESAQAVPLKCPECGMIVSMREIVELDEDSGSGAAVSVTARNRDEPRAQSARRYAITIRQAERENRVINLAGPAMWRPGERVIVIDGAHSSDR